MSIRAGEPWNTHGNQDRRRRKMAAIDDLPKALRELVHDVGWNIVKSFMDAGVKDPRAIARLVKIVQHETTQWKIANEVPKKSE